MRLSILLALLVTGSAYYPTPHYRSQSPRANFNPSPQPEFNNYKVFHPVFPLSIRSSVSSDEIQRLFKIKNTLSNDEERDSAAASLAPRLPWKILPQIGVVEGQNTFSRSQIDEEYTANRHHGMILWAVKTRKLAPGVVLLNNW